MRPAEEEMPPPGGNSLDVDGSGSHLGLKRNQIGEFEPATERTRVTCLVCVLLAVHRGLSLAIIPKSKSMSASTITADVATAVVVTEADCFFARFLFLCVCVSVVLLRGDTVVCVVLLYLEDSVCVMMYSCFISK